MSQTRTIARLETLLARVRTRAAEPRARRSVAAPLPPAGVPVRAEPPIPEEDDQPTLPPPPIAGAPAQQAPALDIEVTVEEPVFAAPAAVRDSPRQSLASDVGPDIEQGREEESDEPPVSSRRPVMPEPEERLAEMAFGEEDPRPPRHSPPPESGRLPAAPSAPFETADATNPSVEVPTRELSPDVIRAELAASTRVADVIGEAQAFAPSTFAALLGASLAL